MVIYGCDLLNLNETATSIRLLIQKIGSYLENLVLEIYEYEYKLRKLRAKLFDAIIDFCEKIKFLHLSNIYSINIPQLSKMILNFGDYLKYLTIEVNGEVNSQIVLRELSKSSLHLSLYYLDLHIQIDPDHLQTFFENFNQFGLKNY